MEIIILWIMFFISVVTILQKRPFHAVLLRMALSAMAVGVYALYLAPDVAITEAMLGAILMTFVYILILKVPGKLRIGYIPTRFLFEEHFGGFDGIQYDIINKFAKEYGYELEYEKFDDMDEMMDALQSEYIDLACGPIVVFNEDVGILETKVFEIEKEYIDFLSLQSKMTNGEIKEEMIGKSKVGWYTIAFSESHVEFGDFIKNIKVNGTLEKIKDRYLKQY